MQVMGLQEASEEPPLGVLGAEGRVSTRRCRAAGTLAGQRAAPHRALRSLLSLWKVFLKIPSLLGEAWVTCRG